MIRFLIGLLYLILVVWAAIDILQSSRTGEQKFIWIAVIIFFPVAGPIIYYLISRNIIKM
jgi:hypothetical protein